MGIEEKFHTKVEDCSHNILKHLSTVTYGKMEYICCICTDCGTSKMPSDRYEKKGNYYIRKKFL